MAKTLKPGDTVSWDHSQGTTTGKVVRKQTTPTSIKGHKVAASKSNPEYIVKSSKTGAIAAHKPDELRKGCGRSPCRRTPPRGVRAIGRLA